jgi:prepilin-type processing-associated H-X9-DG protein
MAYRMYPPGTVDEKGPIVDKAEGYHHNWLSQLLPYMEQRSTFNHIDFSVGVYHENNAEVRDVRVDTHVCPSSPQGSRAVVLTHYAGCHHDLDQPIDVDNHGVFFLNSEVRYPDVSDGTTQTIFIGERICDLNKDLGWMSGTSSTLRNTGETINAALDRLQQSGNTPPNTATTGGVIVGGFGSYHPGGAQFAFGDGHVTFLANTMELTTLQQLGHRADGKLLKHSDY